MNALEQKILDDTLKAISRSNNELNFFKICNLVGRVSDKYQRTMDVDLSKIAAEAFQFVKEAHPMRLKRAA